MADNAATPSRVVLDVAGLAGLLGALRDRGYRVVGPTNVDGAIVYDELTGIDDLPRGWTDEQAPGHYRLKRRDDGAFFGYAVGPHSWKKMLYPPEERLWSAHRDEDGGFTVEAETSSPPRFAFVGVRACEVRAMEVQDRVFLEGPHVQQSYADRRRGAFVVVVQCGEPAGTCFCASMGTGPRADAGFDLALTEILDADGHRFFAEVGSERGAEVLAAIAHREASDADASAADAVSTEAASRMGRAMETEGLQKLLYGNLEHPRWDDVAERCTTCANCTMVCPTCFCATVEDTSDLTGDHAERWRRWDSCFTLDFSYLHGGSVRSTPRERYRQWMTHKLATWHDQFGTSGCVGCGRCITWCPTGIDITEEVSEIRRTASEPLEAES